MQLKATWFTTEEKKAALRDYSSPNMTSKEVSEKHGVHITTLGGWSMSASVLAKTGFSDGDFAHRRNARGRAHNTGTASEPHSQVDGMATIVQDGGKPKAAKAHKYEEAKKVHANFCPICNTDLMMISEALTIDAPGRAARMAAVGVALY